MMNREITDYSCPSAQPDTPDARVFGIVLGNATEPRIAYLEKGATVSKETIEGIEGVSPTRVFRFAGKCANGACGQFRDGGCRLGKDIAKDVQPVLDRVPACNIRATCRWFAENGPSVCLRCARVVTTVFKGDEVLTPIVAEAPIAAVQSETAFV